MSLMANMKTTSSPKIRKGKVFDLDKLQQPLKEGWTREVVIRASSTKEKRRCDIYYHPPKGSKLRSAIEVQKFLARENSVYTEDNFSFSQQTFGFDEPYEILRDAKAVPEGLINSKKKSKNEMSNAKIEDVKVHHQHKRIIKKKTSSLSKEKKASSDILRELNAVETPIKESASITSYQFPSHSEIFSPKEELIQNLSFLKGKLPNEILREFPHSEGPEKIEYQEVKLFSGKSNDIGPVINHLVKCSPVKSTVILNPKESIDYCENSLTVPTRIYVSSKEPVNSEILPFLTLEDEETEKTIERNSPPNIPVFQLRVDDDSDIEEIGSSLSPYNNAIANIVSSANQLNVNEIIKEFPNACQPKIRVKSMEQLCGWSQNSLTNDHNQISTESDNNKSDNNKFLNSSFINKTNKLIKNNVEINKHMQKPLCVNGNMIISRLSSDLAPHTVASIKTPYLCNSVSPSEALPYQSNCFLSYKGPHSSKLVSKKYLIKIPNSEVANNPFLNPLPIMKLLPNQKRSYGKTQIMKAKTNNGAFLPCPHSNRSSLQSVNPLESNTKSLNDVQVPTSHHGSVINQLLSTQTQDVNKTYARSIRSDVTFSNASSCSQSTLTDRMNSQLKLKSKNSTLPHSNSLHNTPHYVPPYTANNYVSDSITYSCTNYQGLISSIDRSNPPSTLSSLPTSSYSSSTDTSPFSASHDLTETTSIDERFTFPTAVMKKHIVQPLFESTINFKKNGFSKLGENLVIRNPTVMAESGVESVAEANTVSLIENNSQINFMKPNSVKTFSGLRKRPCNTDKSTYKRVKLNSDILNETSRSNPVNLTDQTNPTLLYSGQDLNSQLFSLDPSQANSNSSITLAYKKKTVLLLKLNMSVLGGLELQSVKPLYVLVETNDSDYGDLLAVRITKDGKYIYIPATGTVAFLGSKDHKTVNNILVTDFNLKDPSKKYLLFNNDTILDAPLQHEGSVWAGAADFLKEHYCSFRLE